MKRFKGKYIATVEMTIDTEADYVEGLDFEKAKKILCEELTPELQELLDEELIDPEEGTVKVTQVFADFCEYEVNDNESPAH